MNGNRHPVASTHYHQGNFDLTSAMDVSLVEPSSTDSLSAEEELDRMEQILAIQAQIDELCGTPPRRIEAHPVERNTPVTVPQHQIPTIHTQETSYLSQTIPSRPLPVPENNQ